MVPPPPPPVDEMEDEDQTIGDTPSLLVVFNEDLNKKLRKTEKRAIVRAVKRQLDTLEEQVTVPHKLHISVQRDTDDVISLEPGHKRRQNAKTVSALTEESVTDSVKSEIPHATGVARDGSPGIRGRYY